MGTEISWHSRQGRRTGDNRDYCGIGLRADAVLCVVLDGSTAGPKSGEFARLLARDLIDWFISANGRVTADVIVERLRHIHKERSPKFRSDSASYVIALLEDEKPALILHAGDCLAGRLDEKAPVDWLTPPHTLANAIKDMTITEIAASPLRSRLTRSFRAREFMRPDVTDICAEGDETLVIATDGFWAGLDSSEQPRFLSGEDLPMRGDQDDCSALVIKVHGDVKHAKLVGEPLENLYISASE